MILVYKDQDLLLFFVWVVFTEVFAPTIPSVSFFFGIVKYVVVETVFKFSIKVMLLTKKEEIKRRTKHTVYLLVVVSTVDKVLVKNP